MKKMKIFITLLIILFLVTGFKLYNYYLSDSTNEKMIDAIKFKEEYESLNNVLKDDGVNKHAEINIIEDNVMKYSNYNEIMNILESGTGVIYFGFPECPWCRNAVPELLEAAKETGLESIYYFSDMSFRDQRKLDEAGNVVIEKEGTEEYYNLINKLSDYLGPYKDLNDEKIKRLYVPTVIFVKDGNIVGVHIGTIESQTDPSILLNDKQSNELQEIYKDYIKEILNNSCSTDISC